MTLFDARENPYDAPLLILLPWARRRTMKSNPAMSLFLQPKNVDPARRGGSVKSVRHKGRLNHNETPNRHPIPSTRLVAK
jgi:hypothetical protein